MAERHVTFALRRKLAELRGELVYTPDVDREVMTLAAEQVGAVLLMFNPTEDLAPVKPRRPYRPIGVKWRPEALNILRTAERPLTARELTRLVMKRVGAPNERRVVKSIENSLHVLLTRLEGRGLERVCDKPKRWATQRANAC